MKTQTLPATMWTLIAALLLTAVMTVTANAYWPTTTLQNLHVTGNTAFQSSFPTAIPFTDGSVLTSFLYNGGCYYQIIDHYGELKYPTPRPIASGINNSRQLGGIVPDGAGGAYIVLISAFYVPLHGIYIQRIDSLGNCLWGDTAKHITNLDPDDPYFDVCSDDQGGLLISFGVEETDPLYDDVYAVRVDADGNLPWGAFPVLVAGVPNYYEYYNSIAPDGQGGAYIVWLEGLGTYWYRCQRIDNTGSLCWNPNLTLTQTGNAYRKVISDGEGGCIIDLNRGTPINDLYRVNSTGAILWQRQGLSWYENPYTQTVLSGEPGFFYLGFRVNHRIWGQRVDLSGSIYWWSTVYGAQFNLHLPEPNYSEVNARYAYRYPFMYSIFGMVPVGQFNQHKLYISGLNQDGNRIFGNYGVLLQTTHWMAEYCTAVPLDDGAVVGVFNNPIDLNPWQYYVHAKRVNPDGTLGGPLHLLVDLTSQNPPILIPPSGGSFTFNVAITDTYVVNSHFDAWIELTFPDGRKSDVTLRNNVQIYSNSTISRSGLQQNVPASAPAGTYTYTFYVGSHEYHIPWSQDEFTFEKVAGGSLLVAGKGTACRAPTQEASDWALSGDFFGEGVEVGAHGLHPLGGAVGVGTQDIASLQNDLQLTARPNPFNPDITIRFTLPEAARVTLEVFDINGRNITPSGSGTTPTTGLFPAGEQNIVFDGSNLPSGVYLYRLTVSGSGPEGMQSQTTLTIVSGKMVLLK